MYVYTIPNASAPHSLLRYEAERIHCHCSSVNTVNTANILFIINPKHMYISGGCWSLKEGKLIFGLRHINCQLMYM